MNRVFDFQSGLYLETEIDELFPEKEKSEHIHKAVCAVCRRHEVKDTGAPELCVHCGVDLDATRAHVVTLVLTSEMRVEKTSDAWSAAKDAADTDLQTRWEIFQDALETNPLRAELAVKQARNGRKDPFLDLLRLWLDYQEAGEAYEQTRVWAQGLEGILGKPAPKAPRVRRANPNTPLTKPGRSAMTAAQCAWDMGGSVALGFWLAGYAEQKIGKRRYETNEYAWWVDQVIGD